MLGWSVLKVIIIICLPVDSTSFGETWLRTLKPFNQFDRKTLIPSAEILPHLPRRMGLGLGLFQRAPVAPTGTGGWEPLFSETEGCIVRILDPLGLCSVSFLRQVFSLLSPRLSSAAITKTIPPLVGSTDEDIGSSFLTSSWTNNSKWKWEGMAFSKYLLCARCWEVHLKF